MNIRPISIMVGILNLTALSSCAVTPPVSVANMKNNKLPSVYEAQKTLRGSSWAIYDGTSMFANHTGNITISSVHADALIIDGRPYELTKMTPPQVSEAHLDDSPAFVEVDKDMWAYTGLGPEANHVAENIAKALTVLEREASPAVQKQEEKEFENAAKKYLASAIKPSPTEEMRRYVVQAEQAVKDKKFDDAADVYGEAVQAYPWWPQAHFNRALILGKTGDFKLAVTEMKRYIFLTPPSANARLAQDKIYEWEQKESESK